MNAQPVTIREAVATLAADLATRSALPMNLLEKMARQLSTMADEFLIEMSRQDVPYCAPVAEFVLYQRSLPRRAA